MRIMPIWPTPTPAYTWADNGHSRISPCVATGPVHGEPVLVWASVPLRCGDGECACRAPCPQARMLGTNGAPRGRDDHYAAVRGCSAGRRRVNDSVSA